MYPSTKYDSQSSGVRLGCVLLISQLMEMALIQSISYLEIGFGLGCTALSGKGQYSRPDSIAAGLISPAARTPGCCGFGLSVVLEI